MCIDSIAIWNSRSAFSESEKQNILSVTEEMNDVTAQDALKNLSKYLKLLYGKKGFDFSG